MGRNPIKAQPNPVTFFPNSQTDVDMLTRDVQKVNRTKKIKYQVSPKRPIMTPNPPNSNSPDLKKTLTGFKRFPFNNFTYFSLSLQSAFHLSLTVLVRYRSLTHI